MTIVTVVTVVTVGTIVTVVGSEKNQATSLKEKSYHLYFFLLSQYFWKEQLDTFDN